MEQRGIRKEREWARIRQKIIKKKKERKTKGFFGIKRWD
jgi:hypothetical protein